MSSSEGTPSKKKSNSKAKATAPASGASSLRQRVTTRIDELGEKVEELNVKLRKKDDGHYKLLAPGTPFNEIDLSESGFFKHHDVPEVKPAKSWKSWIFGRKASPVSDLHYKGILLGVLVGAYCMKDATDLPYGRILSAVDSTKSLDRGDINEIWSSLPGMDDARSLLSNLTVVEGQFSYEAGLGVLTHRPQGARKALENRDFTIGEELLAEHGLEKHHPIILVPGIVSTGLESWGTEKVGRSFFRKRLWGTTTMIKAVVTNKYVTEKRSRGRMLTRLIDREKWLQALSIDPETGLDPPGFKVRAAQGLDAASEFIQGYWIWQKIVENLAMLDYDTNSLDMAAYDWRLSYYNLEIRDAYFTRLKSKIETYHKTNHHKVVLCSHSMGGTVILYFLKWVEADPDVNGFGGGGGAQWVDEHIEAWINVAGSLLGTFCFSFSCDRSQLTIDQGVSKAMTAFLSGEMRDTVELHPAGSWVLEKFFSRKERAKLFRRWPGASSMWIKGGNRIWGNHDSAPDDLPNATDTHGRFLSFRHPDTPSEEEKLTKHTVSPNLTMDDASPYILTHTPPSFQRMVESNYSVGFETDEEKLVENAGDHRKWSNPLEVKLPEAPSMKIYCLYGYGKETERSYWYMQGEYEQDESRSDAKGSEAFCDAADPSNDCKAAVTERTPLDFPLARQQWIDAAVTVKGSIPEVRSGVKFGDGDGTIPVVSLGAMCVRGWKGKTRWNPAGIEVIVQEYKDEPDRFDVRGGALTADHVDILGASHLNAAILKIAAGRGDLVTEKIESNITQFVTKMEWD
ncbi:hypothetical protein P7C73_g2023, partial [Tremellales sp. Uapishka_1]